jgi:hypothetical protein
MNDADVTSRGWRVVGETANSRFFDGAKGVLVAMPLPGSVDDKTTATENSHFQEDYFRKLGTAGVVIVLVDGFVSQDKAARGIYQQTDEPLILAVGLVAASLLGRAIASFAVGLRSYDLPVKFFGTLDEALSWAKSYPGLNAQRGRSDK